MDVVVVFDKAAADGFFERESERDGSEESEQRLRPFLVILAYRRCREAEAMLEEFRWLVDK